MSVGRPSWPRRWAGLFLARRALWRALAVRGDEASLAVVISNGALDLAGGSAQNPGAHRLR